jgi:hypothetical protein
MKEQVRQFLKTLILTEPAFVREVFQEQKAEYKKQKASTAPVRAGRTLSQKPPVQKTGLKEQHKAKILERIRTYKGGTAISKNNLRTTCGVGTAGFLVALNELVEEKKVWISHTHRKGTKRPLQVVILQKGV